MTAVGTPDPATDLRAESLRRVGRRRRTTELGLLVLVTLIVCATYALTSLGRTASLPADLSGFLAVIIGLGLVGHIAIRRLAPLADPLFLPLALLLNGLGYVFIARLNNTLAGQQAAWSAISVTGFIAVLALVKEVRVFERYRYTAGLLGLLLVMMPLLPVIGRSINGSRIWVRVGSIGFQPGEMAKIALAIFFAGFLVERRELLRVANFRIGPFNTPDPKHFAPILVAIGVSLVVMVFEKDLGSALLFFILFMVMIWVATGRASYVAVGMSLFIGAAVFAWKMFDHVQTRVTIWLDPWIDPSDSGYQIIQATYALAWGGVTGTGPGLGVGKRIPLGESDFIFAVIGEELGLLGATAIICAFLLLVGSGLRAATRAGDSFESMLAVGLTCLLGFQAFIIVAGVIRLLPLTGVTLPFVSYGGSSLVANYLLLALLVRISDDTERREIQPVAAL